MSDISPAARAVLTAVTCKKYDVPPEGLPAFAEEMAPLIAAALRAAADQLQKRKPRPIIGIDWSSSELYAIAAEMESFAE